MPQTIVLHSGGMDSSICLALAAKQHGADQVVSLGFHYGQRHDEEIVRAERIAQEFGVKRALIDISFLSTITDSALMTSTGSIGPRIGSDPSAAIVVGRNGLMGRIGAIFAHKLGAKSLTLGVIGVEGANSGYRDCSRPYWDLKQEILRIDLDDPNFTIETPLVALTKAETMDLAHSLGVLPFLLETTITCYNRVDKEGCRTCPACTLRNEGLRTFLAKHPDVACSYRNKL